jgi:hypothetical protein
MWDKRAFEGIVKCDQQCTWVMHDVVQLMLWRNAFGKSKGYLGRERSEQNPSAADSKRDR